MRQPEVSYRRSLAEPLVFWRSHLAGCHRTITGHHNHRGPVVMIGRHDIEVRPLMLFPDGAPLVRSAISFTRGSVVGRLDAGVIPGKATALAIVAHVGLPGRMPDLRIFRRCALTGRSLGAPVVVEGSELEALDEALAWLLTRSVP